MPVLQLSAAGEYCRFLRILASLQFVDDSNTLQKYIIMTCFIVLSPLLNMSTGNWRAKKYSRSHTVQNIQYILKCDVVE